MTTGDRPGTRTLPRWTKNLPWTGTLLPTPGRRQRPAPLRTAPVQAVRYQAVQHQAVRYQAVRYQAVRVRVVFQAGPVPQWSVPLRRVPLPAPPPRAMAGLALIRRRPPEVPTIPGPAQSNRHPVSGWSARKATWAGVPQRMGPKRQQTRLLRRRTTNQLPPRCRPPSRSLRPAPVLNPTGAWHLPRLPAADNPEPAVTDRRLHHRRTCARPSTPWHQLPPLLPRRHTPLMPRQQHLQQHRRQQYHPPRRLPRRLR